MASIFSHRSPALSENNYRKYRSYIREDFSECCAYCLMHETFARGQENFELDHFKPKSEPEFSSLIHEYTNIYYSCHVCNQQKWKHWPSEELYSKGYRFVDTCKENFSMHFEDKEGYWEPISPAGEYTTEKIRLNSRHNIEIRQMIMGLLSLFGEPPIDWDRPLKSQLMIIVNRSHL
ncbi:MAG TPA: hypothetical protein G4N96_11650 [Chloroflexi bacterium]|nr:hypothetical protein [Chloroflexota bacterium]